MSFNRYNRCHYDTLGVSKDASIDEIKAAFRKLSLQTHPDIVGPNACSEKFKQISHAASVLTNTKLKQAYDDKRSSYISNHFTSSKNFHKYDNHTGTYRHNEGNYGSNNTRMAPFTVQLFRVRNLILGPIIVYISVSALQYMFNIENNTMEQNKKLFTNDDKANVVQAWYNPKTQRYETPAPWDPIYQQLQPELQYVPRHQVQSRSQ
jgi:curved DNA-binding protein CbpA